ncbi:hypothetical protein [Desmospora activa]|nr:hypothetical protein [Desmospora activa]
MFYKWTKTDDEENFMQIDESTTITIEGEEDEIDVPDYVIKNAVEQ